METSKGASAFPLSMSMRLVAAGAGWVLAYQAASPLAEWITSRVLGLDHDSPLGSAVEFFLYDVPKILLLLSLIVFLIGVVRSFFSPERTRKLLAGKREGSATPWRRRSGSSPRSAHAPRCPSF